MNGTLKECCHFGDDVMMRVRYADSSDQGG